MKTEDQLKTEEIINQTVEMIVDIVTHRGTEEYPMESILDDIMSKLQTVINPSSETE